jgi:hypothetical protein
VLSLLGFLLKHKTVWVCRLEIWWLPAWWWFGFSVEARNDVDLLVGNVVVAGVVVVNGMVVDSVAWACWRDSG